MQCQAHLCPGYISFCQRTFCSISSSLQVVLVKENKNDRLQLSGSHTVSDLPLLAIYLGLSKQFLFHFFLTSNRRTSSHSKGNESNGLEVGRFGVQSTWEGTLPIAPICSKYYIFSLLIWVRSLLPFVVVVCLAVFAAESHKRLLGCSVRKHRLDAL